MEVKKLNCPSCGAEIQGGSNFTTCPYCSANLIIENTNQAIANSVQIRFPVCREQVFNKKCFVYDSATGDILGQCEQGETVKLNLSKPQEIKVVMKGCFGKKKITVNPGEKYMVRVTNTGKIRLSLEEYLGDEYFSIEENIFMKLLRLFGR